MAPRSEILYLLCADVKRAGVTMTEIVGRLEIAFRQKGSRPPRKPCMHLWMPGNDNSMDDMAARLPL